MEIVDIPMEEIKVKDRVRSASTETIQELKASIESHGLINPVTINQNNELIAGERRYHACQELGHETIKANRRETVDEDHELILEIQENVERKDLTFSEKMEAADRLEPVIKAKSEERIKTKEETDLSEYGIDVKKGRTSDMMAEILNMGSGKTYDRARIIWNAKKSENEQDKQTENIDKVINDLDKGSIAISSAEKIISNLGNTGNESKDQEQKSQAQGGDPQNEEETPGGTGTSQEGQTEKVTEGNNAIATSTDDSAMDRIIAKVNEAEQLIKNQELEVKEYDQLYSKLEELQSDTKDKRDERKKKNSAKLRKKLEKRKKRQGT